MKIILLILLLAARAFSAYSFVALTDNANASGGTSLNNASTTVSTGDVLIVLCVYGDGATLTESVTDGTNTYTKIGSTINDAGNSQSMVVFVCMNPTAGTYTQTFTISVSSPYRGIACFRYSGLDNAGTPLSVGAARANVATSADALTTGNLTPSSQPGLLWAGTLEDATGTVTAAAGTGFTDRGTIASWVANISNTRGEDKRITSTSAVGGTFTVSNATNGFLAMAVFVPEASAGGGGAAGRATLLGVGK